MARTPSNMLPLGTTAPNFDLIDVTSDSTVSLDNLKGEKGTIIMFICNHCHFVKYVNSTIASMGQQYHGNEISFIAISSNDVKNYPEDSPELMKLNAIEIILIFLTYMMSHNKLQKIMMQHVLPIFICLILN